MYPSRIERNTGIGSVQKGIFKKQILPQSVLNTVNNWESGSMGSVQNPEFTSILLTYMTSTYVAGKLTGKVLAL